MVRKIAFFTNPPLYFSESRKRLHHEIPEWIADDSHNSPLLYYDTKIQKPVELNCFSVVMFVMLGVDANKVGANVRLSPLKLTLKKLQLHSQRSWTPCIATSPSSSFTPLPRRCCLSLPFRVVDRTSSATLSSLQRYELPARTKKLRDLGAELGHLAPSLRMTRNIRYIYRGTWMGQWLCFVAAGACPRQGWGIVS